MSVLAPQELNKSFIYEEPELYISDKFVVGLCCSSGNISHIFLVLGIYYTIIE